MKLPRTERAYRKIGDVIELDRVQAARLVDLGCLVEVPEPRVEGPIEEEAEVPTGYVEAEETDGFADGSERK
jgi:hypothetical protein